MSVETLSAPVSAIGPAIGPAISPGVESGLSRAILSSAPSIPEISVGGSFHPEIRMSDLLVMPEHSINIADINPDKQVPVAEVVFNQKLFEITYRLEQAQSEPRTDILNLFRLPEHKVDEQTPHFDRSVPAPIARLIFEKTEYFQILATAPTETKTDTTLKIEPTKENQPMAEIKTDNSADPPEIILLSQPQETEKELRKIRETEFETDTQAITEVLKQVQENESFTQEQKSFWQQKLNQVAQTKTQTLNEAETVIQVDESAQTEIQTQAQVQAQAETSESQQPPKIPQTVSIESQDQKPRPTQEEPLWEVHTVTKKQEVAKTSLNKRLKVAQEISDQASQASREDPILLAKSLVYKLDVPDSYEAARIVRDNLEYPNIALDTQLALASVEQKDVRGIQEAIVKSVVSKPPKEKVRIINFEGTVKQSDLPDEPRRLAEEGSQHIVLKSGRFWKPEGRPKRNEPVELDKTKAQKTNQPNKKMAWVSGK